MQNVSNALCRLTMAVLLLLLPVAGWAQSSDPLVGTWNITGTQNGTTIVILVQTFHAGGTSTEFDTSGTNSSASPGESIGLGTWTSTGNRTYGSKSQNFIYDASGNLSLLAVAGCNMNLAKSGNTFTGSCALNFYGCSLAQCPGSLVSGPVTYQMSAKRF